MKLTHRFLLPALCAPLFFSSIARAAFNPSVVDADARWLVYLDLDGLRASALGKEIIDTAVKAHASAITSEPVHLDIQKTLATIDSVTAYGTNFLKQPEAIDGVLIVQGTPELHKILDGFLAQATVSTPDKVKDSHDFPFAAYLFSGDVNIALPPEPIVLISKSKTQLLKAYQLYRGKGASLAQVAQAPLSGLLPKSSGAYFVAASLVPSPTEAHLSDEAPQARFLQMASSGAVTIGENGGQTEAHVHLLASSGDMADKLMKILQGFTAMASLAETNDKQLDEFLKSVTVARDNLGVSLALAYPSDRLVEMIKSAEAKHESITHGEAPDDGKIVAEWKATGVAGTARTVAPVVQTIENVDLINAATVTVIARHPGPQDAAALDKIEVVPAAGGPALRFEAEKIRMMRSHTEANPAASGGKVQVLRGGGRSIFQFPGEDGVYTLKIYYIPLAEDTALAVTVK